MPITNNGKTYLASAITGGYTPPFYLVIDTTKTTLSVSTLVGAGAITTVARVDQAGDTQLIIGLGLASQETVTFSSVSGSGPYTYTLVGTMINAHASGVYVIRSPLATDTMANVLGEVQYDSVFAAGQRIQAPSGFSPGSGQWTAAFYLTSIQALYYITAYGITDSPFIGSGNLHAYIPLGFDHTLGTRDVEIDLTLTLT
jgi:hypothetical protein